MLNTQKFTLAAVAGVTAIVAGVLATAGSAEAVILVRSSSSGTELGNIILAPNSGITTSNATYTGANGAAGVFSGGGTSGLPIGSGIVLSTGNASNAANPSSFLASTDNGASGDTQLTNLVGQNTFNAASLDLNFNLASRSTVSLNYLLASDELGNPVPPANDIFAIFVDGVRVPASPDRVSQLTQNNAPNSGTLASQNVAYNGISNAVTATSPILEPGTHTLRLAIADAAFADGDSALFIGAGSFSTSPVDSTPIPEPTSTLGLLAVGAMGASRALKQKLKKQKS